MNKFFGFKKIGDNGEFRRRRNKKIHARWRLWLRIVEKFFGSEKIGDMGIISETANFFAKIFVEKFIAKNFLRKVEWHGICMQKFMQKIRCTFYVQKFIQTTLVPRMVWKLHHFFTRGFLAYMVVAVTQYANILTVYYICRY